MSFQGNFDIMSLTRQSFPSGFPTTVLYAVPVYVWTRKPIVAVSVYVMAARDCENKVLPHSVHPWWPAFKFCFSLLSWSGQLVLFQTGENGCKNVHSA